MTQSCTVHLLHTTTAAEAENIPFSHPEATVFQDQRALVK